MIKKLNIIIVVAVVFLSGCVQNQKIERKNYYSWENDYGYSQVVKTGNTLYVSGIASNKATLDGQIEDIYTFIHLFKEYSKTTVSIQVR